MSKKIIFTAGVCAIALLCISCGRTTSEVSVAGGPNHTEFYREIDAFTLQAAVNERPPLDDTSGISAPLLPLDAVYIVAATWGGTLAVTAGNNVKWATKLDAGFISAGMFADAERNIYCAATDGAVYSFDIDGNRRWKTQVTAAKGITAFFAVLPFGGGMLCSTYGGEATFISKTGDILWQRVFTGGIAGAPCAGTEICYIPAADFSGRTDTLFAIDKNGRNLWTSFSANATFSAAPVFAGTGVWIGEKSTAGSMKAPRLIALDSITGKTLHSIPLEATLRRISASDKSVASVSWNSGTGEPITAVRTFNFDGKELWKLYYRFPIISPIIFSKKNAVLTGVQGTAYGIYAVNDSGVVQNVFSMEDAPDLNLNPAIAPDGSLLFAAKKQTIITRVGLKKSLMPF
ncbi:MAG: PQQ-binding-like beta-propeller repeat protein [Bacteroidetes bacterium]|nr:PQQ-like beta-propeller repeat protein [Bacteroidota bacterium]MCZ2133392.1 PQQ-binding-like beta-propeller repeat protein [Bacteroidota bacterium]